MPSLGNHGHKNQQILSISPQIALPIGIKIWFNESGGSVMGLTTWNYGEDFASLGIGHFIWHPYSSKRASFNSGFPHLLRYIEARGINIPSWLQGRNGLYCPWSNRNEFLKEQYSSKMSELRIFLQKTIPIQAEYMTRHLQEILPDLLASAPAEERVFIYQKFYSLARTPTGIYALVDYLNFKGAGVSNSRYNYERGTGLLQVLKGMKYAPPGSTPLQAYVWSAKNALIKRVERASASQHTERWLGGWFKRLNTYLEGNIDT
ncbi:MAG TPA: hypothetical protein DCZ38_01640 [Coxiellaceae bacterium]|nr:hypothetical protein [Coxiellaceae bacterium]